MPDSPFRSGFFRVLHAYLEPWRKLLPEEIRRKHAISAVSPPIPRVVVWWLLKDKERLKEEQRAFIGELLEKSPIIKAAYELVWEIRRMIKTRDGKKLKYWFGKVEQSGISESARFVNGLREDEAAVQAAMEYAWSNGQVEGQTRGKSIMALALSVRPHRMALAVTHIWSPATDAPRCDVKFRLRNSLWRKTISNPKESRRETRRLH